MMNKNLPKEWRTTPIGEICLLNPKEKLDDDLDIGFMPMSGVPVSYFGECAFERKKWSQAKKGYTQFTDGDVIFAKITPCFENGKAAIINGFPNNWGAGSTEYIVLRPVEKLIDARYLFAFIKTREFSINGIQNMSGSVGHKRVPKEFVTNYTVPTPSLSEQNEIAKQLDKLLSQVENTKAHIESIPETLKQFRQSVLSSALSGELTRSWRTDKKILPINIEDISKYWKDRYKANNQKYSVVTTEEISPTDISNGWVRTKFGSVFDIHVGATPKRKEEAYWEGDIPWVSSSEVAFCKIENTKEHITTLGLTKTSTQLHPKGTVMLAMIGQGKTRGQAAILDIKACHNQNTSAIRIPGDYILSEYVYYHLMLQYEETRRVGGGNNQQALNKKTVQGLKILLPPKEEQTEIVKHIESYFQLADKIDKQAKLALKQVNDLTQSILAQTFNGELTKKWREQNPDMISGENSAEALLEQIKMERDKLTSKAKLTRKKKT